MSDTLSILVVEDEVADFDMVVLGLKRCGIDARCRRVDTEGDYRTQLQTRPDLILSDYTLPSFSALSALQLLQESGLDIPFIVFTGSASEETVVECMKCGAVDYLLKDRMARLGPAVLRSLKERALRTERRHAEMNEIRERTLKEAAESRAAVALELARSNQRLQDSSRQLKEAQAQLIQSERMASLGQLVAGVAHEINNPLAFVVNNQYLAEEGLEALTPEITSHLSGPSLLRLRKVQVRLSEMKEGLERVKALVLDLRTFSRLDGGELTTVDVAQIIDKVLLLLKHRVDGRILVERNLDARGSLCCYAGRLHQVLMNLLVNAIDAMGESGTLAITTRRTATHYLISVRDTGAGIPEAIRSRIFDPFFTTKPVGQGTGLGLAISYGIVQDHRGSIEVRSEEGVGTEFIVTIPLDLEAQKAQGSAEGTGQRAHEG